MNILGKTLAIAVAATAIATNVNAQTLFTYGTYSVTKEEFLKAFQKNNAGESATPEAYSAYLDLYTKFKVKVRAAKDMKLDSLSTQKAELQGFKSQVAEHYMKDDGTINNLVEEAFQRGKKEIRLAHVYVAISNEATEAEQKIASDKIQAAYETLQKGEAFEAVARRYSDDPTAQTNSGEIGYITAMSLSYDLENLAYSLAPGAYSKPYKSGSGFHIFRNLGERKSSGRLRAAQILLAFMPDATEAQKHRQKQLADSLFTAIRGGSDFKTLAAQFSDDNISYQAGGDMMEFGVGTYAPAFENAAFALAKDGDVSAPVLTSFGYHIIKRLELKPGLQVLEDGPQKDGLKEQVLQSDRMEVARKAQLENIRRQLGFKKGVYNDIALWRLTDTLRSARPWPTVSTIKPTTVLFTFRNTKVLAKNWQDHIFETRNTRTNMTPRAMFEDFANGLMLDYYRDHLEDYNKEFAYQLNEFKEGNLLFEVMQRKIWDKAAADSTGLRNYYQKHKDKYKWEASADAIIFTFSSPDLASQMRARIDSNWHAWSKLAETSDGTIQADSARFELSQLPVPDRTNFQPGLLTANTKSENDNSVSYSYIIKMYPGNEPRDFNAARGFVLNDYQAYLEENWLKELLKKYPVKVNEAVLKSL